MLRGPRSLGSAIPSAMVRATLCPFVLLFFDLLFIFALLFFSPFEFLSLVESAG
jgi:hypothetical protein